MEYELTAGLAWSKGVSKVRGPFAVQCRACGKYVKESELSVHALKCSGQEIKIRQPKSPSFLLQYDKLVERFGAADIIDLPALSEPDRRALKLGRRVHQARDRIIAGCVALAQNSKNRSDLERLTLDYVENEIDRLPRDIAHGVRYLMRTTGWLQISHARKDK